MKVKVLSVRQPFAYFIVCPIKDVENRTWNSSFRGELYIHAGLKWHDAANINGRFNPFQLTDVFKHYQVPITTWDKMPLGGIVGKTTVAAITRNSASKWAEPDMFHWVLEKSCPLPFYPCRGKQGIFTVDLPDDYKNI